MRTPDPMPQEARSAAEFVEFLRLLKEQAGLTYRQLEANAERHGDVLARSTAADMLRRDSLPRPETVVAFVRACGRGGAAGDWLDARNRLAAAEPPPPPVPVGGTAPPEPEPEPAPEPASSTLGVRSGRRVLAVSAVAVVLLAAVGAWALRPDGRDDRPEAAPDTAITAPLTSPAPAGPAPAPGRARIRPAAAPQLCVTDGHDRQGRYRSQVAVQRDCAGATPPDTSLVPVGGTGSFYIRWSHPEHGDGCLTALGAGHVVEGLFEPWPLESCSTDRTSQHFRFEPRGRAGGDGYRIRVVHNGLCLGVNDADARSAGAEIAQQRCTDAPGQAFLVDPVG
ncbi:RICIN domain-containing protein [Kitasatospora sp. NPDC056327]|uniref:RICIN domain-containing protein n=1 Tax=Kitasatospora sp. NPDC056327 TaxID=3345785 RepID=UPI0035DE572C